MKFISVRRLSAFFKLEYTHIDDELIEWLRKTVDQLFITSEVVTIFDQKFNLLELSFIVDQLKDEKVRVFHGWIEQDPLLSEYLFSNGEVVNPNEGVDLPADHQLFVAYQLFVTAYLAPILAHKFSSCLEEGDLEKLGKHMALSPYLSKNKCIEIQQPVSSYLRQLLAQLKVSQDENLQMQLKNVFSYSFVQVLNELDENFYSDAIVYIDMSKLIVQNNDLNPLILDVIKSAILSVKLNKNHREQVIAFSNSKAFNARRKKPQSSIQNFVRSPLVFVAVIAIVINFIFFYPLKKSDSFLSPKNEISGIDGLSAEELKVVDTMLGFKQDSLPVEIEKQTYSNPPKYILTANWESIENEIAKSIYASMIADYNIQSELFSFYQCRETKKELYGKPLYQDMNSFSSFPSPNQSVFNQTNEDLYILVFEPVKEGSVYGNLIAPGRTSKVQLKKGDQLIFYSGQQMNAFNPMRRESNGYGNVEDAKKVVKSFNYHFCGQNVYHFQQLNKIYEVEKVGDIVFDEIGNGFTVKGLVER